MAVSILNRAMGVGLATVGMLALVWWLVAAASGAEAYATFIGIATSWIGYVVVVGLTYAFFQHFVAGVRHFVMDAGAGFELVTNKSWSLLSMIAPIVLTAAVWLLILYKGL